MVNEIGAKITIDFIFSHTVWACSETGIVFFIFFFCIIIVVLFSKVIICISLYEKRALKFDKERVKSKTKCCKRSESHEKKKSFCMDIYLKCEKIYLIEIN